MMVPKGHALVARTMSERGDDHGVLCMLKAAWRSAVGYVKSNKTTVCSALFRSDPHKSMDAGDATTAQVVL